MHFPGISLVEEIEQKFRRNRVCLTGRKTSDFNSRALFIIFAMAGIILKPKDFHFAVKFLS